jgi:hypothetical protein
MDIGSKEMHGQAIDTNSLLCPTPLLKVEEETQMRRTMKEEIHAVGGPGGPLSELHAAAGSGARDFAVVLRTTAPVWTTVT